MKKILFVIGTRPEAIKMAPVIQEARKRENDWLVRVISTGQHREMLHQVLTFFEIELDRDLNLMTPGQSLTEVTSRTLTGLSDVFAEEKPDAVLVQGDTTSVLTGALAAFYQRVPFVGHVEAGLRTFNPHAPFPEEINRRLVSHLATHHFAPTESARQNLLSQQIADDRILVTGNTVIDALLDAVARLEKDQPALDEVVERIINDHPYTLITGHRRENFGAGFEAICDALLQLSTTFPEHHWVYPVHLNPNVRGVVHERLGQATNIHLIEPQPYPQFVWLMNRAHFILTDSGGVQEEAPSLGKPVLVMRETTERPEAVEAGTVFLVGTDREKIVTNANRLLTDQEFYDSMSRAHNPYGDGKASQRIVDLLEKVLS
jgi:UDP-N-acetylglucosamine 2-epimerase (non-hydrolysing)